jgi:hypothetical protein
MGRVPWAFQFAFRAYQRANGTLPAVIRSKESAAGVLSAHRDEQTTMPRGRPTHEVSSLLGVGSHLGSQPGANTSMTIMRAPQRGHGQASTRGVSGATSDCFCGSAVSAATSRSARAAAMLSARLAEANSP